MDAREMIELILGWAEDKPMFDTSFVEKLSDKLDDGKELSDKQVAALENIIEKWDIV